MIEVSDTKEGLLNSLGVFSEFTTISFLNPNWIFDGFIEYCSQNGKVIINTQVPSTSYDGLGLRILKTNYAISIKKVSWDIGEKSIFIILNLIMSNPYNYLAAGVTATATLFVSFVNNLKKLNDTELLILTTLAKLKKELYSESNLYPSKKEIKNAIRISNKEIDDALMKLISEKLVFEAQQRYRVCL